MKHTSNNDIYQHLEPFDDFVTGSFSAEHYVEVPADWLIVVADIVSSTRAVESGRYHEVNYVGAACVVALNNMLTDCVFPTVFGGDGASAAVPGDKRGEAVRALTSVRQWAAREFGLDLRIGLVPVAAIAARGGRLEVGKLQLGPGNQVAMFRGSGMDIADALVKKDTRNEFRLKVAPTQADAISPPDLTDLSCRWCPIKPDADLMLCLIIGARDPRALRLATIDSIYAAVMSEIDQIVSLAQPATNPVKYSALVFKLSWCAIVKEIKSRSEDVVTASLKVGFIHLIAKLLFTFRWKIGDFDPQQYQREIPINSDFRKVTGMVRVVIDCSREQADRIESLLEDYYAEGDIVFGLHRASNALMTCVTPDIENGRHLHYVDGTEGGFWKAATDLKNRLAQPVAVVAAARGA